MEGRRSKNAPLEEWKERWPAEELRPPPLARRGAGDGGATLWHGGGGWCGRVGGREGESRGRG